MNLQSRLDQFRSDNPYDNDTQAKRLFATEDKDLIIYVLALGLATAKQRQRHYERNHIKNFGEAEQNQRVKVVPGPVTGSIKTIPIMPSKKMQNITRQLIFDVWRINGEQKLGDANSNDLAVAINRENQSSNGHAKNAVFYKSIKDELKGKEIVRMKLDESAIKQKIESVYGELRKSEAA